MKKIVAFLVAFVLLFSLTAISTAAEPDVYIEESTAEETEKPDLPIAEEQAAEAPPETDKTATSDFTYEVHANGRTASITDYRGSETSITIPSVIDGYTVKDIKKISAKKANVSNIYISDGIISFGNNAFLNMPYLQTVRLPNTLEAISSGAFRKCTLLNNVVIPPSVKVIHSKAFSGCTSLTDISVPKDVQIFSAAFADCTALEQIDISNASSKQFGAGVFRGCTNLKNVKLPESSLWVGAETFYQCTSLKSIDVPKQVKYIGPGAFQDCPSLTSIKLPSTLESIGSRAFEKCVSLEKISIPNSVSYIDEYAFAACTSLESANLPSSLVTIRNNAFEGCHKLKNVVIPNGITTIGSKAFSYCESITEISIPNKVTELKSDTFEGCKSLKFVSIPKTVTKIDNATFRDCPKTLTIKSPSGSAAEAFAKKQGFRFEAIVDPQKLESPKNFKAKAYPGGKIRLTWKETSGASGYYIYSAPTKTGKYTLIKTVGASTTSYTNSKLVEGKVYYYKIIPYRTVGNIKYKGATAGPVFARATK